MAWLRDNRDCLEAFLLQHVHAPCHKAVGCADVGEGGSMIVSGAGGVVIIKSGRAVGAAQWPCRFPTGHVPQPLQHCAKLGAFIDAADIEEDNGLH